MPQTSSKVVWSRFTIIRLFRRLIREEKPVLVEFGEDEKLLLTRTIHVNPRTDRVAFIFGEHKRTNSELLRSARLQFSIEEGLNTYRFTTARARDLLLGGNPVFDVKLPEAVVFADRRRHTRLQIPEFLAPPISLYLRDGSRLQAKLADLSESGIGIAGLDTASPVRKGMLLRAQVELSSTEKIWLVLEVRYVRRLEGGAGLRAGFRVRGENPELAKLLKAFSGEV
jgi:c-di-GMP-binding flagellar brake protein YcgR